jgi:cytochrome P450
MVTGFEDGKAVLSDASRFPNAQYRDPAKVWWFEAANMVMADPPDHRRLRQPLSPMFTRGAVARLETRIALERLLRVAPEYSLRDVDYGKGWFIRGPERGLLRVAAAA